MSLRVEYNSTAHIFPLLYQYKVGLISVLFIHILAKMAHYISEQRMEIIIIMAKNNTA